jgi:membrane protein implicated in regulation of membrane protease activity
VKWSRLFQPRHPLFWMIMALNGLSAMLSWMAQTQPLNPLGWTLVTVFLLTNAVVSMWLGWRLLRDEPPGQQEK